MNQVEFYKEAIYKEAKSRDSIDSTIKPRGYAKSTIFGGLIGGIGGAALAKKFNLPVKTTAALSALGVGGLDALENYDLTKRHKEFLRARDAGEDMSGYKKNRDSRKKVYNTLGEVSPYLHGGLGALGGGALGLMARNKASLVLPVAGAALGAGLGAGTGNLLKKVREKQRLREDEEEKTLWG